MRLRNANPRAVMVWVTIVAIFLWLGGDDLLAWVDGVLRARAGN